MCFFNNQNHPLGRFQLKIYILSTYTIVIYIELYNQYIYIENLMNDILLLSIW